ncbi:MAG TPA: zf-HC2 domain-containing protein [Ktedonobacterales bacterium]|nr:zf-HC2 domain-containing protein [Ktedonobacterales bacterium]
MRHARAGVLMNLYLDERLNARGALQLERHLAGCAGCRRDLARLRLAEPALREADPMARAQVPSELADQIMRRVAAYEAQRAAELARARMRRMATWQARAVFWRGPGLRLVGVVVALIVAVGIWWRTYPESGLAGAAMRLGPDVLQLLATPGPEEIAWSVWIAGAGLALGVGGWLVRADASAEWRRALAERLPRVW